MQTIAQALDQFLAAKQELLAKGLAATDAQIQQYVNERNSRGQDQ
jgi:hypothetical protein